MFLRTERLLLRPSWPEDWSAVHRQIADEGIVRNLALAPWPYTAADAREFAGRDQSTRFPHFLVVRPGGNGGMLLGSCGIGNKGGEAELGYWIARQAWGFGYATEAAAAVVRIARLLGHARLTAGHFADNPASGRVLVKLGFRATGLVEQRFSAGRGTTAPCVLYGLDLEQCPAGSPGAAGFRGLQAA